MVRSEPTESFFKDLQVEMIRLADHNLRALEIILHALKSWKHDHKEIVTLCCDLLQRVAKHTDEQSLVHNIVHLLCRIAFRYPIPDIKTWVDPLDLRTLGRLPAFIQDGGEMFSNDLMSFIASASWSEESKGRILWALPEVPASCLLSYSEAVVTMLGTVRWSLMERFDRERPVCLVERLPTNKIVQQIVNDESVRIGWMRLLLFFTFRPPLDFDTRPLWRILLHIPPGVPHLFSPNLQKYTDRSVSLDNSDDSYGSEGQKQKEEALWMKLFWSSCFFEMDYKPWSEFRDATIKLGERKPALFKQLKELCFGSETRIIQKTKAHIEMTKVEQSVEQSLLPSQEQPEDSDGLPRPLPNPGSREPLDIVSHPQLLPGSLPSSVASGEVGSPSLSRIPMKQNQDAVAGVVRPPDPLVVAPKDTPPFDPSATRRKSSILSQIHYSPPLSPITLTGLPSSLPQPPQLLSQVQSESPISINGDNDWYLSSVPFGSGASEPPNPGPPPMHPPLLPDKGVKTEGPSGSLSQVADGGDGLPLPLPPLLLPPPPPSPSPPPLPQSLLPPPSPLPLQEQSEDSDHLSYQSSHYGSRKSPDTVSQLQPQSHPPPGDAAPNLPPVVPSLSLWMRYREEGYFEGGV